MKHDFNTAVEFLRILYPEGPWILTAIEPDKMGLVTRTFFPDTLSDLEKWLDTHAPRRNIYYQVNKSNKELTKKAERTDISEVCYLHVDVDPRVGEDLTAEKARIQKLLQTPPAGVPEPTLVVHSGGGYNALWRLVEPIPTGTLEAAEHAKRYNQQLELLLTGDHCHNIDRILRLPGTVNWPDARKKAKGRSPMVAALVKNSGNSYPITMFVAAPEVQEKGGKGGFSNASRVEISGNVRRLAEDLSDLGDKVKPLTKVIIKQGLDPDEPGRFKSRSDALFWVCCELVRGGVKDEEIYSIITDENFAISASVRDKGSRVRAYAIRQIKRAKESAVDPALAELNEKHAVILNHAGRCVVIQEIEDHTLGRTMLTEQSFSDFRNRYMNREVQVGINPKTDAPIRKRLGDWWLENKLRTQYENIVFAPGKELEDSYNLWRGFGCEAIPGKKHEVFLEHVMRYICDDNEEYYDYLVQWMARAVQHPDSPGEVAIVLRGRMGTGKGRFARTFGSLFGRHFLQVSDPKHLVGQFNAHLWDCVVLFGDEAFYAGDKKHASVLKALITEETIMVEKKHQNAVQSRNCVHLILASNDDWVAPVGADERRFFSLDVNPAKMQDTAYFAKLDKEMKDGGLQNLLHFLLTLDISKFNVRKPPKTASLQDQKLRSLSSEEEWWFKKLEEGIILNGHGEWTTPVLKEAILADYLEYTKMIGNNRRSNSTMLGRFLHKMCAGGPKSWQGTREYRDENGQIRKDRPYFYQFPTLEDCRKVWDSLFGGPFKWPTPEVRDHTHPNAPHQEKF